MRIDFTSSLASYAYDDSWEWPYGHATAQIKALATINKNICIFGHEWRRNPKTKRCYLIKSTPFNFPA